MSEAEKVEWLKWQAILGERLAFKFDVADAPAIDAVEVVRCKDCKHRIIEPNDDWCECTGCDINPDGFCEEGERKEDV